MLLLLLVLLLVFGFGGGYVGNRTWGPEDGRWHDGPGIGIFGIVLLVLVVIFLVENMHLLR